MSRSRSRPLLLAAGLALLAGCSGGAPCAPSFDGDYSTTITTVTPAGTTTRSGTFTVRGGAVTDPGGTLNGSVDGAGAFSGTTVVCDVCSPMAMSGTFSGDAQFTLAGSSGSVSQTITARRTRATCSTSSGGGGGTGGGSAGGGSGGAGGGGAGGGGGGDDGGATAGGGAGGGGDPTEFDAGTPEPNDAGPGEVFNPARVGLYGVAVDDTFVYWTETSSVLKADKATGTVQALAANRTGGPQRLDLDDSRVYWNEDAGTIHWVAKTGGAPTQLHHDEAAGVRVVAGSAYWPNRRSGTMHSVRTDGSGLTTIAAGLSAPGEVTADGTWAWFTDASRAGGSLSKVAPTGGPVTRLVSSLCEPQGVAVDATHVYLAERCYGRAGQGTILRARLDGSAVTTLARGLSGPSLLRLSGGFAYWLETTGQAVRKVGVSGGPVVTLANTPEAPLDLAVDATHVYWTEPNAGHVKRAPK